jgi:hypothetical protein
MEMALQRINVTIPDLIILLQDQQFGLRRKVDFIHFVESSLAFKATFCLLEIVLLRVTLIHTSERDEHGLHRFQPICSKLIAKRINAIQT